MTVGQKRKGRWSNRNPSKLMIRTKPIDAVKHSRSSHEEYPLILEGQTDGPASLIRRNSARLLSIIGWKSSNGQ